MLTSWKMQRLIAGLNQADLARKSGVGRRRVSLIERGIARPTGEEYTRLVKVLAYRKQRLAACEVTQ